MRVRDIQEEFIWGMKGIIVCGNLNLLKHLVYRYDK